MPTTSTMDLTLPPAEYLPAELRKPAQNYQRLVAEMRETGAKVRQLAQQIPTAETADRRALADALREGKKDPGTAQADKVRKEADEARRQLDGYRDAVDAARADLEEAILAARPKWTETIAGTVEAAETEYRTAVETLATAHDELQQARTVAAWLARFPHKPALITPDPNVAGTRWSVLVADLRAHGNTPTPTPDRVPVDERLDPLDAA